MQRVLHIVRIESVLALSAYLVAIIIDIVGLVPGATAAVEKNAIALILLGLLADASLSLAYPQLAKQPPARNSFIASLYQASFFYETRATKGYTSAMVVLFGVLFAASIAKLLGYW